jgi:hypothetical protein
MSRKYIAIDPEKKDELASIQVGDFVRINDWKRGMKVTHRTERYLLLMGNDFGENVYSVIELLPSTFSYNDRKKGKLTAGPDYWLFGWNGWVDEQGNVDYNDPAKREAYLRTFETGETEFSRRVNSIQVKKK